MDGSRFDCLARRLTDGATRRGMLLGLVGGFLAPLATGGEAAHAGKRKRKKKKRCKGGKSRCDKRCIDTRTDPANCGGCGRACVAPDTCGGGNPGTPGTCGCTQTTCAAQGKNCGAIPDACGGTLNCGDTCPDDDTCGGGGMPNVCGCLANGEITTDLTCQACCSGDCCFAGPGIRVCAGGCG